MYKRQGERLLRRARAHAEEHAVEHHGQQLKLSVVAPRQVGLQRREAFGERRVVRLHACRLGEFRCERRVQLLLVATRQQRVHARAVLAEIHQVLHQLG